MLARPGHTCCNGGTIELVELATPCQTKPAAPKLPKTYPPGCCTLSAACLARSPTGSTLGTGAACKWDSMTASAARLSDPDQGREGDRGLRGQRATYEPRRPLSYAGQASKSAPLECWGWSTAGGASGRKQCLASTSGRSCSVLRDASAGESLPVMPACMPSPAQRAQHRHAISGASACRACSERGVRVGGEHACSSRAGETGWCLTCRGNPEVDAHVLLVTVMPERSQSFKASGLLRGTLTA